MSQIALIAIAAVVTIAAIGILAFFIFNFLGFFSGGPYIGTPYKVVDNLFRLVKVGKKDIVYDLGSGDGRILIAAAKHGAGGVGWEINYPLYLFSVRRIKKLKLDKKIKIHYGNFWRSKLEGATVIFAFLFPKYMRQLEKKLTSEVSSGTLVVTYKARLPGRKPIKESQDGLAVYYF